MKIIATIAGPDGERIGLGFMAESEGGYRLVTEHREMYIGGGRWEACALASGVVPILWSASKFNFQWA